MIAPDPRLHVPLRPFPIAEMRDDWLRDAWAEADRLVPLDLPPAMRSRGEARRAIFDSFARGA